MAKQYIIQYTLHATYTNFVPEKKADFFKARKLYTKYILELETKSLDGATYIGPYIDITLSIPGRLEKSPGSDAQISRRKPKFRPEFPSNFMSFIKCLLVADEKI